MWLKLESGGFDPELVLKRPPLKEYPIVIYIFGYNLVRICENCYFSNQIWRLYFVTLW